MCALRTVRLHTARRHPGERANIVQQNRKALLIGGPRTIDGEVVELTGAST
ncbi:hypothetical protein [Saccharothrix longispora]|uniref:hypothetical protein n=1 Tax=Saccharothrix longispora TaxID=33920 RepID=UPI0028FD2799|nr:hypothetical protein [Saccharothrix longispora]MDU0292297.1 hypothetical protein [Saccharothrix longispora]